jgi:hypothetical protein
MILVYIIYFDSCKKKKTILTIFVQNQKSGSSLEQISVLHYFSYVFNIKLSYQTEHIEIEDSRDDRVLVKETSSARRKSIQPNSRDQVLVENWIFIDSTRNYKSNWATCLGTAEKLQMKSLPSPEVRVRQ